VNTDLKGGMTVELWENIKSFPQDEDSLLDKLGALIRRIPKYNRQVTVTPLDLFLTTNVLTNETK